MNKFMRQKVFLKKAGDQCVLWVRPSSIEYEYGSKWQSLKSRKKALKRMKVPGAVYILRALKKVEPYVIPRERISDKKRIEDGDKYKKVKDFIVNEGSLEQSQWFLSLSQELRENGCAVHKDKKMASQEEILCFLESYYSGVVNSLKDNGFMTSYTGFESTAIINADGSIGKTGSGYHRFYIAKALDLPKFPLKIVGVHEDWYDRLVEKHGKLTVSKVLDAFGDLEMLHS